VLVVGCHDGGKRPLIRALLGVVHPLVTTPPASYLVMRHGPIDEPYAHAPGSRRPRPYGPGDLAPVERAPARPPRRVELTLPDPLLRHFTLVESPCVHRLGLAGARVLADAAERGGAVVFVASAEQPLTRGELDLLAELSSRDMTVFFALASTQPPAAAGALASDLHGTEHVASALDAHRAAVARHAPHLDQAPWFTVDPAAGDTAYLRRALVDWAGVEGLRRASHNPPVLPSARAVHVAIDAAGSGWQAALDRWLRSSTRLVSQRLAIEVANTHLRCVQDLVFGAGCPGLPEALDHELHALSHRATAESDTAVATIVHEMLQLVLNDEPTEDVRRRVAVAVRRGLAEDADSADLARVLLVTGTGGVATVAGEEALLALPGYDSGAASPILPPVGLAVSGSCYGLWHNPANADAVKARSWLQRVTRAVELDLSREVGRRFEAVHRSLGGLIGETVDHGILLA
jgi:hypothetical protein